MALTHETGAFDRPAISVEIARRLADKVRAWKASGYEAEWIAAQSASYLPTITEWVEREARIERHDIFERTMASLTTTVERARITQLMHLGNCQPISGDGNIAARDFFGEADRITRAIRARTEAHFSIIEQASLSSEVRAAARARAAVSAN